MPAAYRRSHLTPDGWAFARSWAEAWNRHDVEAVIGLFAEDVVFTSPLARSLPGFPDGEVRGKAALRDYWTAALAQVPDLRFDIRFVQVGIDLIIIGFRNQQGVERCEILKLRDGLVLEGHGTYPAPFGA
ncbi:nuclear transport factor 2 family protein [Sphingomonas sp.]|uniref:nuclear transport factor 2 family protein n=1 Tax=Sphingomonas sp. TaxID=28214 RepID=UPI003B3B44E1